jgi:tetrahydromethanopterin S-methyltransferase subunit B
MLVKIKDEAALVRDASTNAVLNTDMSALEQYRARRAKATQLQNDVEDLKSEMSEIKELLRQLVNRDAK